MTGSCGPRAHGFVWLEQLIIANLHHLFPGLDILRAHVFHLTRDAEVAIKELETDDLLETIEEAVWQRRFRDAVRLQVDARMPAAMIDFLAGKLELDAANIFRVQGPLDLSRLRHLLALDRPDLKDKPFLPHTPSGFASKEDDVFDVIRQQDQLLHHPYESFQPVVEFLRKAAKDPDVLAIKMTLYRLGRNSPIVEALLEAVENGKQVAVVVELKARFDEESNIEWARALEREGVHVVYGLLGLKVHSKVILVVRREGDVIRRYCHLATGNYNPATARLYTDLGLFTCDEEIGADATDLFNYLTGYSRKKTFRKLLVAPLNLAPAHGRDDSAGNRHPAPWGAGPDDSEDERAGGRPHHQAALSGFPSRGGYGLDRARRVLSCGRRRPASARTFTCAAFWAGSWSTAAFSTSATMARRNAIWAAPI